MPASVIADGLRRIGAGTRRAVTRLGFAARFTFAVLGHSVEGLRRIRLTLREIYFAGALSLVIILVSGLFVGMVLALQGYDILQRYGASESLGVMVALSLLRVMAAARNLLARVRARGRHARHNVRVGGKGRQSRIARHARRGRTRLKIRFEVEHEHERED